MKKVKENARAEYQQMIEQSWTWARMTDKERAHFTLYLQCADIKGSFDTRWHIMNLLYHVYLDGIGYDGPQWRASPDATTPLF